jgi:hypothetical protein
VSTLPPGQPGEPPSPGPSASRAFRVGYGAVFRAMNAPPGRPEVSDEPLIPWPRPRIPRAGVSAPGTRRRRPRPPAGTRRPLPGLLGLLVFALIAGFFGWVSAEPAWLAVGHGRHATVTVGACTGAGLTRSCTVLPAAAAPGRAGPRLVGAEVSPGQQVPVREVGAAARIAYAGSTAGLVLRAVLGLVLVLACGAGVAWATGVHRLRRRARLATALSLAGPVLLALGFLAAAW